MSSRHPNFAGFSAIRIETPRLVLRPLEFGDAAALFDMNAHPDVSRYGSGLQWTSVDMARERIATHIAALERGEYLQLAIAATGSETESETGGLIGTCCLFDVDAQCRRTEIGYGLARQYWGRGYAHEAIKALVQHAFNDLNLRRLEADVHPDNLPSLRLLERLGFVREGYLRERWEIEGEVSDSVILGLLQSDWRKIQAAQSPV